MNDLVEELKEDRLSLKVIIKGMRTQREYIESQPSQDAQKLASAFNQIQGYAKALFVAICRSCTCKFQDRHKILLQLHNRIPAPNEKWGIRGRSLAQVAFNLVLDVDGNLQETLVKIDPLNTSITTTPLPRLVLCQPSTSTPG